MGVDHQDSDQQVADNANPAGHSEQANQVSRDTESSAEAPGEQHSQELQNEDKTTAGSRSDKSNTKAENGSSEQNNPTEDDSINIMIGDEDVNFDDDPVEKSTNVASPPRPENAPVVNPFTSRDTISMHSRTNKAHSENSSMLVNPDDESVGTQGSNEENKEEEKAGDEKEKEKSNDSNKKEPDDKKSGSGRNLWVSILASFTRASDLKSLFSKYGKVIGAKVVTNARTPGAKCYGYVTMDTVEDAQKCIDNLNNTELNGRTIVVETARADGSGPMKGPRGKEVAKKEERRDGKANEKDRDNENKAASSASKSASNAAPSARSYERERDRDRDRERDRPSRSSRSRSRVSRENSEKHRGNATQPFSRRSISPRREDKPKPGVLTFAQIKDQRERHKERLEERRRRERERRRLEEEERRRREMERRRRGEEEKLQRERDELKREREKLEREKQELMKFERERQRLERERLQREKEELERLKRQQQMRIDDLRRGSTSGGGSGTNKRPIDDRDPMYDDRKRSNISDHHRGSGGSGGYERPRYGNARAGGGTSSGGYMDRVGSGSGGRSGGMSSNDSYGRSSDRGHHQHHRSGPSTSSSSHRAGGSGNSRYGGHQWSGSGGSGPLGMGSSSSWGTGGGRSGGGGGTFSMLSGSSGGNMPMVQPFGGGGSGMGGFGSQSSFSTSDRFDAYKNSMMGSKRY